MKEPKTLLIGQPTMLVQLALSARKLEREGEHFKLVCGPELSDPVNAWKIILQLGMNYRRVIIVGVPYRSQAEITAQQLTRAGIETIWVMHASTRGRPLGYLLESGINIHLCGNRASTYYGREHKEDLPLLRFNQAEMWDPDFHTDDEAMLRRCWGFRNCAAEDRMQALDILRAGNLNELDPYFRRPQVPRETLLGSTLMIDWLPAPFYVDTLMARVVARGATYGIGIRGEGSEAVVLVLRAWNRREALPAPYLFGLINRSEPTHSLSKGIKRSGPLASFSCRSYEKALELARKIEKHISAKPAQNLQSCRPENLYQTINAMTSAVQIPWYFTDHSFSHNQRMMPWTVSLAGLLKRRDKNQFAAKFNGRLDLLFELFAAMHDLGHAQPGVDETTARKFHHKYSREMVLANARLLGLNTEEEVKLVADLCFYHRLSTGEPDNLALRQLVGVARAGDQFDMTFRRSRYNSLGQSFPEIRDALPSVPGQIEHFESHRSIRDVTMQCSLTKGSVISIGSIDRATTEFQVSRLRADLSLFREIFPLDVELYDC